MTTLVLLDTGPLGLVTHPKGGEEARLCKSWLHEMLVGGARVVVPAISDYELRRELYRAGKLESLARLDELAHSLGYLSIDGEIIREAAMFWANARTEGRPTAPDLALDGDCILAAQARLAPSMVEFTTEQRIGGITTVIATNNPRHLELYAPAKLWSEIKPEGSVGY
jgi:predicted nucleic acid-binding protein